MNGEKRYLKEKGECDYDYVHDILFFKVKDRQYEKSIEIGNMVVDIDNESFIVGLQIFEASKYFVIPKNYIRTATNWRFEASAESISEKESRLEIRFMFQVKIRNRIVQPRPIITENVNDQLKDSMMVCVPARK